MAMGSFRESAISEVGQIHKVIRDQDFSDARERIIEDPILLIQANSVGWTALHFFAAAPKIPLDDWQWVLEQIPPRTRILTMLTDMGLTPTDHFFLCHLHPLPWQRPEVHEAAKVLRERIQQILESSQDEVTKLKQAIVQQQQQAPDHDDYAAIPVQTNGDHHNNSNDKKDVLLDFWKRMEAMMRIGVWNSSGYHPSSFSMLHALAMSGCPEEVSKLALRLYPDQMRQADDHGRLALHWACCHRSAMYPLETLLSNKNNDNNNGDQGDKDNFDGAIMASTVDAKGKLPIVLALANGRTWGTGIARLWSTFPLYGGEGDPTLGFPAFVLASFPDPNVTRRKVQHRAAQNHQGMWRFLNAVGQSRALAEARQQVELEHLDTVYQLLRAAPNAISICRYNHQKIKNHGQKLRTEESLFFPTSSV